MVGKEHVDQRTVPLELGELLHAPDMRGALRVQVHFGRSAEHERQRHLREQDRLQVRLGLDRLAQPRVDLVPAHVRDGVALAVRAVARLGIAGGDLPVPRQPAERGVHLAERQLLPPSEEGVVIALEVVAVARLPFKQTEQGEWDAHAGHYMLGVYPKQITALSSYPVAYCKRLPGMET